MGDQMPSIRDVKVEKDEAQVIRVVRATFGPHYFVKLTLNMDDTVTLTLGATHHGFHADASQVNGELETLINEIRERHPNLQVD